jgi:hypothetical protein
MTEKPECMSVHEDFEGIFDEGSRLRSNCAELFNMMFSVWIPAFTGMTPTRNNFLAKPPLNRG